MKKGAVTAISVCVGIVMIPILVEGFKTYQFATDQRHISEAIQNEKDRKAYDRAHPKPMGVHPHQFVYHMSAEAPVCRAYPQGFWTDDGGRVTFDQEPDQGHYTYCDDP